MANSWKCEIHNREMEEKLDNTKSKIIPYCSHCKAKSELTKIYVNKTIEYVLEKNKRKSIEDKLNFQLTGYLIGLIILAFGLGQIYFVISGGLFEIILFSFLAFLYSSVGCFIMYCVYKYQKGPKEPILPTIESLINGKVEIVAARQTEVDQYKRRLESQYRNQKIQDFEMNEIDLMSGFEFEEYTAELLKNFGYKEIIITPKSGDFGADVIAIDNNNIRVAIQCKRYGTQNLVRNDAIQQIYSAMSYFDCKKAIVITTSNFSKPALQMAQKLGVELWARKTLIEKIVSISEESWDGFLSNYYINPQKRVEVFLASLEKPLGGHIK